jgi:hypothetical protein
MAEMLHSRVSNATLGIVRAAVYGMWAKHLLEDSVDRYIRTPVEFFTPVGPLAWLPDAWWPWIYRVEVIEGGRVALLVGIGLCVVGLGPYRLIAVATCFGLTLYQAFVRGYGYIHHGELAMLFAAYVLAIYPAQRGFSLQRTARSPGPHGTGGNTAGDDLNRAAMLTICLALCFTYAFVGAHRLVHGGIGVFFDGTILHYITVRTFETDIDAPGLGRLVLEIPALGTAAALGYAATTVCELFAPLAIFARRFRWIWITTIIGFHLAAGLLMGIWFTANIALVLLCMTDLERVLARCNGLLPRIGLRPVHFLPVAGDEPT